MAFEEGHNMIRTAFWESELRQCVIAGSREARWLQKSAFAFLCWCLFCVQEEEAAPIKKGCIKPQQCTEGKQGS